MTLADAPLTRARVFMTGRDCAPYARRAIASVARQTLTGLHLVFVDDASDDDTAEVAAAALAELLPGRHTLVRNEASIGKAGSAWTHLGRVARPDEFTAVVDADDELVDVGVLEEVARCYDAGDDVVWTNYVTDTGLAGMNRALDPTRSPRDQGWVTSHLFTFRSDLFDAVRAEHLQDDAGEWLRAACDVAIAYPVLDQTRRYRFLPLTAYRYTATNPASHHNRGTGVQGISAEHQRAAARVVASRPPLACTRGVALVTGAVSGTGAASAHEQAMEVLAAEEGIPLDWLREVGGWSMDVQFYVHLREVLDTYERPRLLEFGSGMGSKILATMCRSRGGSLLSVEHNPAWHARTVGELERHGLGDVASVQLTTLQDIDYFGVETHFYDMSWLTEDHVFDVVLVDGPPTDTGLLVRLCGLPSVAANLSPEGFHVFLDDYERQQEQVIGGMWRTVAPELTYRELTFAKKALCVTG